MLLACSLWLIHLIQVFSFEESANLNLQYIPENATNVYRLDGRVLTRELLASLLISEDEDLKKMAQRQIPTTSEGKLKPVGISFDSDIILFRLKENGSQITGMLFNLWDRRTYDKNLPKLIGKNSAIASTENVGLLLLQIDGNKTQSELTSTAKKMLSKPTNFTTKHPEPGNKSLISAWYQEDNSTISDVGISVQDNQLLIRGAFTTNTALNRKNLAKYRGGFHVHSQWLPEIWSKRLQEALKEKGIDIPVMKQFSLNYFGTTIITDPSITPLPTLSATVEFESPIEIDTLFRGFERVAFDSISQTKVFDVFSEKYEITRIDPRTVRVKSQKEMDLQKVTLTSVAEISGSPDKLLKIDGDDYISQILMLSSDYRAVSSLIEEITSIDIKMTPTKKGKYRIYGKIVLKDDKWPLNELLKFLIRSKLL